MKTVLSRIKQAWGVNPRFATLLVTALVIGAVGGYEASVVFGGGNAGVKSAQAPGTENESEQWYTCGMHPNVIQKGPGKCPICHMDLTPLKKDQDASKGGTEKAKERKVLYWRAPMDPNYISEKPGKSPMGMDLVPVYADKETSTSPHTIRIDPVTIQNMGIRTAKVTRGPLVKTVRTVGRVDYDEQRVTFIDTKFKGWIEKLHVDKTGQVVKKGQPLFEVYSPDLYGAQEEYLAAARNLPRMSKSTFPAAREQASELVEAAVRKLKYMDISDVQIARMRKTGKIEKSLTILSPAGGIVTEKMALEGMYVNPGMRLYTISDLSKVWVYVDVYEYQLPWIRMGQEARMTLPYVSGKAFQGKVVYVYPYLDEQTRVIKVRLEFDNPTLELKPGMFANVDLKSELGRDALLIPREAYIDTGERKLLFLDRGEGKFMPREIQVGVESDGGNVEVLYGLSVGDVVVTSGQFLLDAESKLKEAVAKMMEVERNKAKKPSTAHEGHDMHEGHSEEVGAARTSMNDGIPVDAAFACPMEEHPRQENPANRGLYFSNEPGDCPRCGMALVALEEIEWVKTLAKGEGSHMAYTCPEHPHVFSETTGSCPICGGDLKAFKAMYTCPDMKHGEVISKEKGKCPHCGRDLVAFRGIWLDESMAEKNVAVNSAVAAASSFRCSVHPLVHSSKEGKCPICARSLQSVEGDGVGMEEQSPAISGDYVCPMHPEEQSAKPGKCSICGMQLVHADALPHTEQPPAQIAQQINYITEHYLELQSRLSSDTLKEVTLHASGLQSAAAELLKLLLESQEIGSKEVKSDAKQLVATSAQIKGESLQADRVAFVKMSDSVKALLTKFRPDKKRWPKLYFFHCPMSKGHWIQTIKETQNPYYGAEMLSCGDLVEAR